MNKFKRMKIMYDRFKVGDIIENQMFGKCKFRITRILIDDRFNDIDKILYSATIYCKCISVDAERHYHDIGHDNEIRLTPTFCRNVNEQV